MSDQEAEIISRDKDAESYEIWYLKNKGYYYDWVEKKTILNALNLKKEDIVLDAGCGTGRFTREIAKKCQKVYAVDFSPKSIDFLNKKALEEGLTNIETYIGDVTRPFPVNEWVNKIVSVQVIQHIPTDSLRQQAVNNLYSCLKPRGVRVLSLYNANPIFGAGMVKEGRFADGIYYHRFTPSELETLMKISGFKNVSVRGTINLRIYSVLKNRWLGYLLYPAALIDLFLSRFPVSCRLGSYLVCRGIK